MLKINNRQAILVLSAIFLVVPLLFWGLWILSFSNNPAASQQEKLAAFYAYFPEFIRDQQMISLLVIVFGLLAVVFASIGIQRSSGSSKLIGILLIVIGILLLLLQMFTMM